MSQNKILTTASGAPVADNQNSRSAGPLGPLSFSLAMPIKKPDDADTQVFQFSLGQTF